MTFSPPTSRIGCGFNGPFPTEYDTSTPNTFTVVDILDAQAVFFNAQGSASQWMPTAAQLVAGLASRRCCVEVGDHFFFSVTVSNGGGVAGGQGIFGDTGGGNATGVTVIDPSGSNFGILPTSPDTGDAIARNFTAIVTNVDAGTEAITVY